MPFPWSGPTGSPAAEWVWCGRHVADVGLNRPAASGEARRSRSWVRALGRCADQGSALDAQALDAHVSVGWYRTGFQEVLPVRRVGTRDCPGRLCTVIRSTGSGSRRPGASDDCWVPVVAAVASRGNARAAPGPSRWGAPPGPMAARAGRTGGPGLPFRPLPSPAPPARRAAGSAPASSDNHLLDRGPGPAPRVPVCRDRRGTAAAHRRGAETRSPGDARRGTAPRPPRVRPRRCAGTRTAGREMPANPSGSAAATGGVDHADAGVYATYWTRTASPTLATTLAFSIESTTTQHPPTADRVRTREVAGGSRWAAASRGCPVTERSGRWPPTSGSTRTPRSTSGNSPQPPPGPGGRHRA